MKRHLVFMPAFMPDRLLPCLASMVFCGLLLAGCADLTFLRGDAGDNLNKTTINGALLDKKAKAVPVPTQKTNDPLLQEAEAENKRIIKAYGGVYTNRQIEDQLARIVARLVAKSERPAQSFNITILDSPVINAFALPGGYLFITRGLLALANDASEVAAVLAHEMSHVTAEHGQERLLKARTSQIASKAVADLLSDPSQIASIQQGQQLSFASFTQLQELSADAMGVRNIGLAGYDPFAAARFLEVMADYQAYRARASVARFGERPDFLSSHPTTPDRITKARLAARQFGAPGFGDQDRDLYLKSLDNMIYGDEPKQGFVRDRSFIHPQLAFTFSVPNGYIIENKPEVVLATAENGDQIRFDGVQLAGNESLENYIQSGWLKGVDSQSITSFTVNGAPAVAARAVVGEWTFKVTVIRTGNATYRMVFATREPTTGFDRSVSATVASFRSLTPGEVRNLSPLRLKIIRTRQEDTSLSLSERMRGLVANPEQAFRVLNGLGSNGQPKAGTLVKIITDGVSS